MIRYAMKDLVKWMNKYKRLPLIIKGARQVGKTWLMKEFGRQYFEKVAYISFDNNERMKELFKGDLSPQRIILGLCIESGIKIEAHNTLIVLDEIQEVPAALTSLKYFAENAPEYFIVSAGSLLGVALHGGTSFPVGKVEGLDLYPLSFTEFLEAYDHEDLVQLLDNRDFAMITAFKSKYIELLRQYYYVGGMPEAVKHFVENKDFTAVREIQKRLLMNYEQDFSKHAPHAIVPRIRMVWDSIPAQLAKENKKFIYGVVREGGRAKDFELAIQWLLDCGLTHKVGRVTKGGVPLKAYQDFSAFKLYVLDVGLLGAMAEIEVQTLLEGNEVFKEFKGALTEQYVCQQLIADCKMIPYYWSAENSSGEVDFIIESKNKVIPIEAKAEENLKAKSLKSFREKNKLALTVRTSMSNYREQEGLINVPLYAISTLTKLLD